jgi:uncharacterized protein (TIGR01777 family)
MRVAVSGASGLVGSTLVRRLTGEEIEVLRLVRGPARRPQEVSWDAARGVAPGELAQLDGLDALVHLAGETIARRWTDARKAEIRRSRVEGTRHLCEALVSLRRPPRALLCASAVGYYGSRKQEVLREDSPAGTGFLAEVCQAWEAATEPAARAGVRVTHLRFGMILSTAGGALRTILLPFRLGLGGRIGRGDQYMSWVALDDAIGAIRHLLVTQGLTGPVNVAAPSPVTNAEFTRTLARALSRPAFLPVPATGARLVLGEMAEELLLASQRALPTRLQASGYQFLYPKLEDALEHLLR